MQKTPSHQCLCEPSAPPAALTAGALQTHNESMPQPLASLAPSATGISRVRSGRATKYTSSCLRCHLRCPNDVRPEQWADQHHTKRGLAPKGNACRRCFDAYHDNWSGDGTFEGVSKDCNQDAATNQAFEDTCNIRSGAKAADFEPEDVLLHDGEYLEICDSAIGVSRATYCELVGETPESRGLKLQDLKTVSGRTIKGFLCKNPNQPYTVYNVKRIIGLDRIVGKLRHHKHYRKDLGQRTYIVEASPRHSELHVFISHLCIRVTV